MDMLLSTLAAILVSSVAQASPPPVVDSTGREVCKVEIDQAMKKQIGFSYFNRSDRQNTADAKKAAARLSVIILNCLDILDAQIEKNRSSHSPEKRAAIDAYIAARRAGAEEEFYQAMIRAGFRPSNAPPRRYAVCELRVEFPDPGKYSVRSVWSPVFYDREADNLASSDITGKPHSKTDVEVIEALRKWARSNDKPFRKEFASCDEFDTHSDASQWLSDRLKSQGEKAATISLPPSAMIPIP